MLFTFPMVLPCFWAIRVVQIDKTLRKSAYNSTFTCENPPIALSSKMTINPNIESTRDGTTTLYSEQFGQTYHNRAGAVTESRHVFFETPGIPRLLADQKNLSILEIGFGTGLNLVLLLDYLNKTKSKSNILFRSIEAFPIDPQTASKFDFGSELEYLGYPSLLENIFSGLSVGLNRIEVNEQVVLELFVGDFEEAGKIFKNKADTSDTPPPAKRTRGTPLKGRVSFNFIFHDPFSPDANPEGWTSELFKTIATVSADDAILTTYCAATKARAAMAAAGWYIARAPGAPGKREMTVASLSEGKLEGLKRVNEKRLVVRFFGSG